MLRMVTESHWRWPKGRSQGIDIKSHVEDPFLFTSGLLNVCEVIAKVINISR